MLIYVAYRSEHDTKRYIIMLGMVITHNILGMNAQRQYNTVGSNKKKSTEKLSSGFKINRAADDAAGLTISEKMRRNIRGLNQASKNIQDGISLLQVADGALNEDHAILQRMNELAVQAANGTNTVADRAAIQAEIRDLIVEVDRIANSTTFNDKIYPLNHGNLDEINPSESMRKETIDLSSLADGVYNGYTYYDGNITITGEGEYTIKNAAYSTHNTLSITADATITLETVIKRSGSGACITVEEGVNATIQTSSPSSLPSIGTGQLFGNDKTESIELKDSSTLTIRGSGTQKPNGFGVDNSEGFLRCGNNVTINIDSVSISGFNANSYGPVYYGMNSFWANNEPSFGNTLNIYNNSTVGNYLDRSNYWPMDVINLWSCNFSFINSSEILYLKPGQGEKAYNSINILKDPSYYYSDFSSYENGDTLWIQYDCYNDNLDYENSDEGPYPINNSNDEIWIQAGDDAGEGMVIHTVDARAEALGVSKVNVASESGARKAIDIVKGAIDKVSAYRSYFGAMQNRLEHAMAIDDNTAENTQAAESLIRDTDMTKESANLALQNILTQAGVAMMSQANQSAQGVLQLLQ